MRRCHRHLVRATSGSDLVGTMIPNIPFRIPQEVDANDLEEVVPKLTGPKRQHIIPRFYLEGFTTGNLLAVYDRKSKQHRRQQPENTAVNTHFYSFEDADGNRRYDVEHAFGVEEGKAAVIVKKLVDGQQLADQEIADFSVFVAVMACRTPSMIDSTKAMHGKLIKRLARATFGSVESVMPTIRENPAHADKSESELKHEARILSDYIQSDGYEVVTNHQWAMGMTIGMIKNLPPILVQRHWRVLHSTNPKRSFVTSDSPVVLSTVIPRPHNLQSVGFANVDAMVLFPLSQNCALLMFGEGSTLDHRSVSDLELREYNLMVANRCQRFLFARDVALNRSLVKYLNLDNKEWRSRISVS